MMAKTTANELESFRPYHPGELLKDELEYRHISQRSLAKQPGLHYTAFNEVPNGSPKSAKQGRNMFHPYNPDCFGAIK